MISLNVNCQPEGYYRPIYNWGLHPSQGTGVLLFYEYPFLNERLLSQNFSNLTAYSVGELLLEADPLDSKKVVYALQQRKRGLSRRFQSEGIPVWVDLTIRPDCESLMLWGVPDGWKAYTIRKPLAKDLLRVTKLAQERAGGDILLVCYGGSWVVEDICRSRGWHYEPEWSPHRKLPPARNNPLRKDLLPPPVINQGKHQLLTLMV